MNIAPLRSHCVAVAAVILLVTSCQRPQGDRFPGFSSVGSGGPASSLLISSNDMNVQSDGKVSFKLIRLFPDAYVIQDVVTDLKTWFTAADGVKYDNDEHVIGTYEGRSLPLADLDPAMREVVKAVKVKIDQRLKVQGVSEITDANTFIRNQPVRDLVESTMGSDAALLLDSGQIYDELQSVGNERFASAASKQFFYVNLATGRCITGVLSDEAIAGSGVAWDIYGSNRKEMLPSSVSDYIGELRQVWEKAMNAPFELRFKPAVHSHGTNRSTAERTASLSSLWTGTYRFTDKGDSSGTLRIEVVSPTKLRFKLQVTTAGQTTKIDGTTDFDDNLARYKTVVDLEGKNDDESPEAAISLHREEGKILVSVTRTNSSAAESPSLSGTYCKVSDKIPKFEE